MMQLKMKIKNRILIANGCVPKLVKGLPSEVEKYCRQLIRKTFFFTKFTIVVKITRIVIMQIDETHTVMSNIEKTV